MAWRAASVRLTLQVSAGLRRERWAAPDAPAFHRTVHSTLVRPPRVDPHLAVTADTPLGVPQGVP